MSWVEFHNDWAWFVIAANAVAGLWCLGAHWIPALRVRPLWWFVIGAEASVFVAVATGVYLVAVQGIEAGDFHMFYGFVTLVTVVLLYSYRNQIKAWQYLLYGFGGLFLMGLGIRAVVLG